MCRILFVVLVGVLVPWQLATAQGLPVAKIADWEHAPNGSGVVFKPLNAVPAEAEDGFEFPDQTANGLFDYAIKSDDLKWAEDCRCYRYYTVTIRSRDGRISRHKFRAFPSGSFEDQRVLRRLTIARGDESDGDDVALPVASAPGLEPKPLVTVTTREAINFVSLGGETEVQLILRNPSAHVAVHVPNDIEVTPDAAGLWSKPPVIEGPAYPLRLNPGASATIRIRLEPNSREAIAASFRPTSNDKPHTALHVKVGYANPLFQSREGVAELTVPIRFRPGIWTLAIFLSLGVALGSLVLFLSRKVVSIKRLPRAVLTALGVALILELVGMFMVAYDSKFVLFTFDLDPWQTLPVLLLGIGNGLLGFEAARLLKFIKEEQS
jgi:hypothetical protein